MNSQGPGRNLLTLPTQEQNPGEVAADPGLPVAPRREAEGKLSLVVGPSRPVATAPARSDSQARRPDVPPSVPFRASRRRCQVSARCSLRGGQPSSLGISCHCGPEPGAASFQVSPGTLGLSASPGGAERGQGSWQRYPDPGVAELGAVPATPDTRAGGSPRGRHAGGAPCLLPALGVTLACPRGALPKAMTSGRASRGPADGGIWVTSE